MSRKTRRSDKQAGSARAAAAATRQPQRSGVQAAAAPNRPLLALAGAGIAVAGYLTCTGWTGGQAAYCEAGGGCDIVQSSQWATLLGVPTALWGLLVYVALAWIAIRVRHPLQQWRRAWALGVVGLAVSVYLTAISLFVIQATCPYCLASLAILAAIVALLVWQRPVDHPRFAWSRWTLQAGAVAILTVAAIHAQAASRTPRGPEDPYLRGLAERLDDSGAIFYGASWCPHCQEQKAMFGASADRLPYVEC